MRNPRVTATKDSFTTSIPSGLHVPSGVHAPGSAGGFGGTSIPGNTPIYYLPFPGHSAAEFSLVSTFRTYPIFIPYVAFQGFRIMVPFAAAAITEVTFQVEIWNSSRDTIIATSNPYHNTHSQDEGSLCVVWNWDVSPYLQLGLQNTRLTVRAIVNSGPGVTIAKPFSLYQMKQHSIGADVDAQPIVFSVGVI